MKQRDLVKKLESAGFEFVRHGRNHDIYQEVTMKKKFRDTENLMSGWQKQY